MPGDRKARTVVWREVFYYVAAYVQSLAVAMLLVLLLLLALAWWDGAL